MAPAVRACTAPETTAQTSHTRETVPGEITRRDDQRTEQGDHQPRPRHFASIGRYTRPRRSFERRRAVYGRVWRPRWLLAGQPGRAGQFGGHRIRAERD